MSLISNDKYTMADISGKEENVKTVVEAYVDSIAGSTDDEKRVNYPYIKKSLLHGAVDYVMANLPAGVTRVDGLVIQPILDEVCAEKLAALPQPVSQGE